MKVVSADFAVSDPIWKGIASGAYERVGGVVRDTHTKQVVAWLHEIGSSQAAVSSLVTVGSVSSLLTLGVAVIGFALVLDRLSTIQDNLKTLEASLKRVENKIDMAAYANFEGAIKLAETAIRSNNPQHRTGRAQDAATKLLAVEALYKNYAEAALNEGNVFSYDYLRMLHLGYAAAARCYLEVDDMDEAIRHLQEGKKVLRPFVEKYVNMMLTSDPAVYLHPSVEDNINLTRLTKVFRWQNAKRLYRKSRQVLIA